MDTHSPLKELYTDKNDMPIMTYPHDLGTSRKGHWISFTVMIPEKAKFKDSAKSSQITLPPAPSNIPAISETALNSVASVASQASALGQTINSVTSAVGSVASVANQVVSTATGVLGAASSVVGAVSGAASIVSASSSVSGLSGAVGTAAGVVSGISSVTSTVGALASTVGDIPGVSSFLNDPMGSVSNTWDSIKNFVNNPSKLFSSDSKSTDIGDSGSSAEDYLFAPSYVKPSGYINLYMPDTVHMDQHATYSDVSLTSAFGKAGVVANAASRNGELQSVYDQLSSGSLGSAIKTLSNDPLVLEGAGYVAQSVGAVANGGTVADYLLKTQGYAINPQLEVIFKQMDFRTFQFDFFLTPKNEKEAETVREIIQTFRIHAAPSIQQKNSSVPVSNRYFITPSIFKIQYMFLESENTNLHKFAPCVLETIKVDYAPEAGWVSHNDGMPVKTRLTLLFRETEILTKDKIQGGY